MKFGTKAIHAGVHPDPETGAIMTPIYQTSTYVQAAPGNNKGYEYARTANPTRTQLQDSLAALENGKYGICFSSGMGAIDAVIKLLNPGDHVIAVNDIYGGSYRLFTKTFQRFGIEFTFTSFDDPASVEALIKKNTRLLWIETPTNPLLQIADIEVYSAMARKHNVISVVDNTFASPYLQNPLDLGAHIVMHSMTKYLGGHSDVVAGGLVTSDDTLAEELKFNQKSTGATPGPQDCFLLLRGIKTLHLRMQRHSENGRTVADFLAAHPAVDKVFYPGLSSHKGHEIAKKQMRDFGGMMSFTLKNDSMEAALKILSGTELFSLAESLGGVESLIGHPASMTHASIPKAEREKVGVTDSLIRLSVGVEDIDDLLADLTHALKQIN
ncbi:MAG: cystathionine gamma-synthase [Bacteroidia bacterium]|nr:cystathionine gamma-synthase [Bacteroidia bacterium]